MILVSFWNEKDKKNLSQKKNVYHVSNLFRNLWIKFSKEILANVVIYFACGENKFPLGSKFVYCFTNDVYLYFLLPCLSYPPKHVENLGNEIGKPCDEWTLLPFPFCELPIVYNYLEWKVVVVRVRGDWGLWFT